MADPRSPSPRSRAGQGARSLLSGRDVDARTQPLARRIAETTPLTPEEERDYQKWVRHYGVKDIDPATGEPHSDVHYDMRGYWKGNRAPGMAGFGPPEFPGAHGPDTWKQKGHETFSVESQYARPGEGGVWAGETLIPQPTLATSRRPSRPPLVTGTAAPPTRARDLLPEPRMAVSHQQPLQVEPGLQLKPDPAAQREKPPVITNPLAVLGTPGAAFAAGTGALLDRPGDYGGFARAAWDEAKRAPWASSVSELSSLSGEARERGVDLDPVLSLATDLMGDPTNLFGGDPFSDLAKVGVAMAAGGTKRIALTAAKAAEHLRRAPVERVGGRLLISTRVPSAVKAETATAPLVSGLAEAKQDPEFFGKMAEKVRSYPILTGRESRLSDEGVVQAATERVAENIDALGRMQSPAARQEGTRWYRGGQRLGDTIAADTTRAGPERLNGDQGTFLLASQSPTREWPQNVSLAERMARWWQTFNRTDQSFTRDHFNRFVTTTLQSAEDWIKKQKYTGAKAETTRVRARAKVEDARTYIDVPWSELPQLQRARLLRAHSEIAEPQTYASINSDGDVIEPFAMTADGKKKRTVVWQSYGNMERGLWILDDPSDANLSVQVGKGQKVRSFANNLSVPEDPRSFTVDTHEVAGGHFQPFGGKAREVKDVMAGHGSASTGLEGLHPLYRDAGIQAAGYNRLIPNQQQSVSWQGVQGLFSPSQRRDTKFIADVRRMWEEHSSGRITSRDLLGRIYDYAAYHRGSGGLGAAK